MNSNVVCNLFARTKFPWKNIVHNEYSNEQKSQREVRKKNGKKWISFKRNSKMTLAPIYLAITCKRKFNTCYMSHGRWRWTFELNSLFLILNAFRFFCDRTFCNRCDLYVLCIQWKLKETQVETWDCCINSLERNFFLYKNICIQYTVLCV